MAGITHLKEFQKDTLLGLLDIFDKEKQELPTVADKYFPTEKVYSSNIAYDIIKTNQYVAPYIGYGAEPPVIDRNVSATKVAELGKFGHKHIVTEEELLALHRPRTTAEQSAMIDKLWQLTKNQVLEGLFSNVQLTKTIALFNGYLVQNSNGIKFALNLLGDEYNSNHFGVATDKDKWTATTAKPLSNLIEWVNKYEEANGVKPTEIFMTRKTFSVLATNSELIAEARGAQDKSTRISDSEVRDVLAGYDLPPITIITNTKKCYVDHATGTEQTYTLIPDYRVVFAHTDLGVYAQGITVESDFEPRFALTVSDLDEPIVSVIRGVGAGVAYIKEPSKLYLIDVNETAVNHATPPTIIA